MACEGGQDTDTESPNGSTFNFIDCDIKTVKTCNGNQDESWRCKKILIMTVIAIFGAVFLFAAGIVFSLNVLQNKDASKSCPCACCRKPPDTPNTDSNDPSNPHSSIPSFITASPSQYIGVNGTEQSNYYSNQKSTSLFSGDSRLLLYCSVIPFLVAFGMAFLLIAGILFDRNILQKWDIAALSSHEHNPQSPAIYDAWECRCSIENEARPIVSRPFDATETDLTRHATAAIVSGSNTLPRPQEIGVNGKENPNDVEYSESYSTDPTHSLLSCM